MTARPDMAATADLLAQRIQALAPELLPAGRRQGPEWRCGSVAGEQGQSLGIRLTGAKAGTWADFGAGDARHRGDALDLVAAVLFAGDKVRAWRWGLAWLGLSSEAPPARVAAHPYPRPPEQPGEPPATLGLAQRLWQEAGPAAGTPVESYLASRGLVLPDDAPLRFHPAPWRRKADGPPAPAMVALMTCPATGEPVGAHLTYLRPDGTGKAEGARQKVMLGRAGVVRLVPDAEVTQGLGLAEGIETALSVAQGMGWRPVWAATTAGGIARLPVLAGIEALTLFTDADDSGAGMNAALACAERWSELGRGVRIVEAPAGRDFNDVLTGKAA